MKRRQKRRLHALFRNWVTQLKPEQLKVIMEFICGKDVFAVLPTGFGKTLCYACLPLVFDELTHGRAPSGYGIPFK